MTWEEHKNNPIPERMILDETDIECPNCGKKIYRRTDVVLTTYPPTFRYECIFCHWCGYAKA